MLLEVNNNQPDDNVKSQKENENHAMVVDH